jgi:hypothetical protein
MCPWKAVESQLALGRSNGKRVRRLPDFTACQALSLTTANRRVVLHTDSTDKLTRACAADCHAKRELLDVGFLSSSTIDLRSQSTCRFPRHCPLLCISSDVRGLAQGVGIRMSKPPFTGCHMRSLGPALQRLCDGVDALALAARLDRRCLTLGAPRALQGRIDVN